MLAHHSKTLVRKWLKHPRLTGMRTTTLPYGSGVVVRRVAHLSKMGGQENQTLNGVKYE